MPGTETQRTAEFRRITELESESPTVVEGLPGHGLVASIAVDQITDQLGLEKHGVIQSEEFPPVATFSDGKVGDLVRVYAGEEPSIMTLQSDIALPPNAFKPLGDCVLNDLADEFEKAVFLAGSPAQSEETVGTVRGVATTDRMKKRLEDAEIEIPEDRGIVGGITGSLVNDCYHADVPAAVLIVEANPYLPDPNAARAVVEEALEPLLGFDIDTSELVEQAERIQRQKQQIAQQLKQRQAQGQTQEPSGGPGMYQ